MKAQSSHEVVMERTRRAMAMKAEGKTLREMSSELGVSKGVVSYYLYTVGKKISKPKARRGVVSVLGSKVNSRSDDKVISLLAEVLRLLPDDKLVEMVEAAHE